MTAAGRSLAAAPIHDRSGLVICDSSRDVFGKFLSGCRFRRMEKSWATSRLQEIRPQVDARLAAARLPGRQLFAWPCRAHQDRTVRARRALPRRVEAVGVLPAGGTAFRAVTDRRLRNARAGLDGAERRLPASRRPGDETCGRRKSARGGDVVSFARLGGPTARERRAPAGDLDRCCRTGAFGSISWITRRCRVSNPNGRTSRRVPRASRAPTSACYVSGT
jgi:hypothetical protein